MILLKLYVTTQEKKIPPDDEMLTKVTQYSSRKALGNFYNMLYVNSIETTIPISVLLRM